tara:strand:- start:96 stop:806 length:711 start_codon:yes stop_codon:yes gene_type:complete
VSKQAILAVALVALVIAAFTLPIVDWLAAFFAWVQANPAIAWAVFIVFYVSAVVLMLPGSILTLGAGYLFGLGYGFVIVSFASTVGATCAFLVGRFFAREWVAGKLSAMPRFSALDRAVGARGALVVLLTRLSPAFPFTLLNYALGLTQVPLKTYVLVSWLGMMPGTLLYVYLGSIAQNLTAVFSGELAESPVGNTLLYLGLAATLALTVLITRFASGALDQHLDTSNAADEKTSP